MWKWINWAARLVATALLLSFLCIWTTGYIVNSYVQTVLKSFDIPITEQPFALSGIWGKMWGAGSSGKDATEQIAGETPEPTPTSTPEATLSPTPTPQTAFGETDTGGDDGTETGGATSTDGLASPGPAPAPTSSGGTLPDQASGGTLLPGEGESVPVWNGTEEGTAQASPDPDLAEEKKQKLYAIVVSKLSNAQLKQLTDYLDKGLSTEEIPKVKALLQTALTADEVQQMMDLLKAPTGATAQ